MKFEVVKSAYYRAKRQALTHKTIVRRVGLGCLLSAGVLTSWQISFERKLKRDTKTAADSALATLSLLNEDLSQKPFSLSAIGTTADSAAWQDNFAFYFRRVKQVKSLRDSVLVSAWRQKGVPYVWGGSSPGGFDCSGLLQFSFRKAGLIIPRTAAGQATMGKSIPLDEAWLAPGDLLIFKSKRSSYVDHIGMYLGNGQYIHAYGGSRQVSIGSMRNPADISNRILIGARRVFHLPYKQPALYLTSRDR